MMAVLNELGSCKNIGTVKFTLTAPKSMYSIYNSLWFVPELGCPEYLSHQRIYLHFGILVLCPL